MVPLSYLAFLVLPVPGTSGVDEGHAGSLVGGVEPPLQALIAGPGVHRLVADALLREVSVVSANKDRKQDQDMVFFKTNNIIVDPT